MKNILRVLCILLLMVSFALAVTNVQVSADPAGATAGWVVRWIDDAGAPQMVKFHGPDAEARARAYAANLLKKK